jgi:hypothetical protein
MKSPCSLRINGSRGDFIMIGMLVDDVTGGSRFYREKLPDIICYVAQRLFGELSKMSSAGTSLAVSSLSEKSPCLWCRGLVGKFSLRLNPT